MNDDLIVVVRGNLENDLKYKHGKRDGCSKTWFTNGQLKSEYNYKDGSYEGISKDWYETGNLRNIFYYKDGKRHGCCKHWTENGNLEECKKFAEQYDIFEKLTKNGKKDESDN